MHPHYNDEQAMPPPVLRCTTLVKPTDAPLNPVLGQWWQLDLVVDPIQSPVRVE